MKKYFLLLIVFGLLVHSVKAQPEYDNSKKEIFRAFPEKINDMVHTKLDAKFDYQKSQLNGKVWLTLKPHFYAVDNLKLDAKGMDIHVVQLVEDNRNISLQYTYDSKILDIDLGKKFSAGEEYTVYIEYTAKPNELNVKGSWAIAGDKGLYFINPEGKEKDKPTQIWTQGETESNSAWIPIIDKPNQKSTEEMILTVPQKYVTLSNGSLVNQKVNSDGTRTDTWKMEQPHAPYLFFMGIGDYAIVKDSYKGKEVSYYVEKPYKDVARKIFGNTPEMIAFFSQKLGVEYPWVKYSQMTARDYVSGAMENTTATLHRDAAQQNARQLTDQNIWETIIAHELFHQWFGDLVTCESWSNITVNESFADFSEGMWMDYKYGKDDGEATYFNSLMTFLSAKRDSGKVLVRYHYADKEDVFDRVSYQKGGSILNMLKNFVGEDAFFQSLNTYLTRYRYGTGNARKLQQAFEDVTGKDLNWFFNQWYYSAGYPELEISYDYSEENHTALVYTRQKQTARLFKLPVHIDVYEGKNAVRYSGWIENANDTFRFDVSRKPELINVDADKVLIVHKTDNKTLAEFIFQYQNAKNYVDRWEAVNYAAKHTDEDDALAFLETTLKDPNYRLRLRTLRTLQSLTLNKDLLANVVEMVKTDPSKLVAAQAIRVLNEQNDKKYKRLFISCLKDSSYSVAGAAYSSLINLDEKAAVAWLPKLDNDALGALQSAVKRAEILNKTDADFDEMYAWISNSNIFQNFRNLPNFIFFLGRVNDTDNFKKGIKKVMEIQDKLTMYNPNFKNEIKKELIKIKEIKENKKSGKFSKDMLAQLDLLNEIINTSGSKS